MRLLYSDEGIKWRRKWEPVIQRWRKLSENWVDLVSQLRLNKADDLGSLQGLSRSNFDPEAKEFFTRLYNKLLTLNEVEGFKRTLILKSRDENLLIQDFVNKIVMLDYASNGQINYSSVEQCSHLKEAVVNYISQLERTEPILNIGGMKVIPYEHFHECISNLKELLGDMEFSERLHVNLE